MSVKFYGRDELQGVYRGLLFYEQKLSYLHIDYKRLMENLAKANCAAYYHTYHDKDAYSAKLDLGPSYLVNMWPAWKLWQELEMLSYNCISGGLEDCRDFRSEGDKEALRQIQHYLTWSMVQTLEQRKDGESNRQHVTVQRLV